MNTKLSFKNGLHFEDHRWWEKGVLSIPVWKYKKEPKFNPWSIVLAVIILALLAIAAFAEEPKLKASWYSVESLKKEGTWKHSKGVMANGKLFKDSSLVCATRIFPMGQSLCITNIKNGKSVIVKVADKIGKRFAKSRVDLSKSAFQKISDLKEGLILVNVEVVNG